MTHPTAAFGDIREAELICAARTLGLDEVTHPRRLPRRRRRRGVLRAPRRRDRRLAGGPPADGGHHLRSPWCDRPPGPHRRRKRHALGGREARRVGNRPERRLCHLAGLRSGRQPVRPLPGGAGGDATGSRSPASPTARSPPSNATPARPIRRPRSPHCAPPSRPASRSTRATSACAPSFRRRTRCSTPRCSEQCSAASAAPVIVIAGYT